MMEEKERIKAAEAQKKEERKKAREEKARRVAKQKEEKMQRKKKKGRLWLHTLCGVGLVIDKDGAKWKDQSNDNIVCTGGRLFYEPCYRCPVCEVTTVGWKT